MAKLTGTCKEVLDKTEFVTIVTWTSEGPEVVGTWGDYIRAIGLKDEETIIIPAGGYQRTEANLKQNDSIQLLIASKEVPGTSSAGQGCRISGRGEIQVSGEMAEMAKAKFSWARGALVVRIEQIDTLL